MCYPGTAFSSAGAASRESGSLHSACHSQLPPSEASALPLAVSFWVGAGEDSLQSSLLALTVCSFHGLGQAFYFSAFTFCKGWLLKK